MKGLTNNLFSGNGNSSSWGGGNNSWGSGNKSVSVGSDNRGVVDDVLGGVVGHVLLDGDLGNVLDGVVSLVSNMVDNWGSGNSNWGSVDSGNWGSVVGGNWGSSVDSGNSWGSVDSDSWGSGSNCGYWGSGMDSSVSQTKSKTITMGTKENLGISISSWGSVAASDGQEDSLKFMDHFYWFGYSRIKIANV